MASSITPIPLESEMKEQDGNTSDSTMSMESDLEKERVRLTKLERIKKKLRDRDSRLSVLVRDNSSSLLKGDIKPYETRTSTMEDDSLEAVRVLSYAAFKLQRQVDKKTDEAQSLRRTLDELEEKLQEKEKEQSTVAVDMNIFRRSLEAHSEQIDRLSIELDTKNKAMAALIKDNDHQKKQAEQWKGRLAASRKDYEWMRKESMSKSEQIEYFEYELLSKNDEIDNLHQEFDRMLRRIAELEVDLELMDARSSRSLKDQEGNDSCCDITKASLGGADPAAEHIRHAARKRNALFRLRELKCQSKAEDTEAEGALLAESSSGEDSNICSFPTDASTVTTSMLSHSTDFSSPSRILRSTGRKSGKGTKGSPENQYIDIIDNLRSDLLAFEAKYKQDKYNTTKLIEKLKQENNEYLIKLVCMDCKTRKNDDHDGCHSLLLEDINDEADSASLFGGSALSGESTVDPKVSMLRTKSAMSSSSKLPNKDEYLQKKVESLEGQRIVHQRTIEELTSKLTELEKFARHRQKADKRTIDDLVFQNGALAQKIAELEEHASSRSSRSLGRDQGQASEYTARLEDKVQKQSVDLENLQLQNDLKDRTIEALRAQLIDRRVSQKWA